MMIRGLLLSLVFVCLLVPGLAAAQAFAVDESRITGVFQNGQLNLEIPISSSRRAEALSVRLEVLDENDIPVAKAEFDRVPAAGIQKLAVPISSPGHAERLLWYRLRYTAFQPGSPDTITNTVAISEITPELFELQVTAPRRIFPGMSIRAHVVALHPYSKKPVRNVNVTGHLQLELDTDENDDEVKITARGRTDSEGIASLEFKVPAGIKLYDSAELLIDAGKNGITRSAESYLSVSGESFVYLFTDKPLYQPGQKLFIRGLYLDPARRPIAGEELEIEIRDEDYETVLEKTVTTSRFGVVTVEWDIPADLKLGNYSIEVENDDSDGIGFGEFKVSRYDLPNFSVNAKPAKPYYLLSDTEAEVRVDATYLFGKPVQGGIVRIVEERERTWNFNEQKYDTQEGRIVQGTANADGMFTARVGLVDAVERLKETKWMRFVDAKFAAYYTDPTTNRTEHRRFDIRVSREPIHIYFARPAADPSPTVPFQFYVSAFYADGSPAKADLDLSGGYENAYAGETLAKGTTNSYGAAKFELKFPEKPFADATNRFNLKIAAKDKDGNTGTFDENIYVDPASRHIRVKTDKTIYAPGEPIFVKVLSTERGPVFLDISKRSSVIWSKQVKIKDGSGSVTIPYRPDLKGELTITAHGFNNDGEEGYSLWSKTIIYPTPTDLAINLSGVKDSYRPGEEARLAFNVKTGERKPAESALGIVMLDKAIEERAQTDGLRDNMADLRRLLGTADRFGELKRTDLDKIDTSRSISNDLQLAAEYLLASKFEEPRSFSSDSYTEDFGSIYRAPMQKRLQPLIDALQKRHQETFEFPNDTAQLSAIAAEAGFALNDQRDAWNTPFLPSIKKVRGDVILEFHSASADKKHGTDDDFLAAEIRFPWFAATLDRINKILRPDDPSGPKPRSAEQLIATLKGAGAPIDSILDGWGRTVSITTRVFKRDTSKPYMETVGNLDGARQEVVRTKAVEQEIAFHTFISQGEDGIAGNSDDFPLGSTSIILSERDAQTGPRGSVTLSKGPTSNSSGAIGGTISDPHGAVIPGSTVTATNLSSLQKFTVASGNDGGFLLADLPSGRYSIRTEATGFKASVIENVIVSAYNLISIEITLEVGAVTETVSVMGGAESINTSNATMSISGSRAASKSLAGIQGKSSEALSYTPRVREYFPETLIWQPELITDRAGRAGLNFKFADSLTTWKLYAFGSTESGEFGIIEKEIQTFQPFFAELDPPKVLTEGDEISLPVPVRNYTNKRQKVTVSMDQNSWSRMPNGSSSQIEVGSNGSQNAIMNFVAASAVNEGRQRVIATAGNEGDSIEKPVTVRPNGREEVRTRSETFQGSASFDVEFPEGSFQDNRSALLKLYPDLLAHVEESVDGLLQRPHGCGEQTTSSTYPNLMLLKLEKDLGKKLNPQVKAKAHAYLVDGYKRLLNYQTPSGGFSYWGSSDTPNEPLTAYVIRFLTDAEPFIDVDPSVVANARRWLESQQAADGSWSYPNGSPAVATAYTLRSLLNKPDPAHADRISRGFEFLRKTLTDSSDPYVLANTAYIATKLGDRAAAEWSLGLLAEKAQAGKYGTFWAGRSTPFYGWGRTAEIETTALAVNAFAEFRNTAAKTEAEVSAKPDLISSGLKFILANKDSAGVWYSTQTTVNVLNTLIGLQGRAASGEENARKFAVLVNGVAVKEVAVTSDLLAPVFIELGQFLKQASNRIEIKSADTATIGAHLVVKHYNDWSAQTPESQYFDLKVRFDKTTAKIGEEITCLVEMRRKNYTARGMVLTEIGLPPGADVDRRPLEAAKASGAFSRYDILPDKVVVYSWTAGQPMAFSFKFKHRYGINAQAAPSIVYDYYNPEADSAQAPVRFKVD